MSSDDRVNYPWTQPSSSLSAEEYQSYLNKAEQTHQGYTYYNMQPPPQPCPTCGRCPTCGGYQTRPVILPQITWGPYIPTSTPNGIGTGAPAPYQPSTTICGSGGVTQAPNPNITCIV